MIHGYDLVAVKCEVFLFFTNMPGIVNHEFHEHQLEKVKCWLSVILKTGTWILITIVDFICNFSSISFYDELIDSIQISSQISEIILIL